MSVYVGIDVHRKRSQIAVLDELGEVQVNRNVPNGTGSVLAVIGDLPSGTAVAFEAAYGWGWLVELLDSYAFEPHLVHPLACKAIASARLKNDKVDARTIAQLLRADILPEAWIAPHEVRQLRALLRHRAQLVRLRTLLRNRIHAVLADHGHDRPASCWSGPGLDWLASLELPTVSREVVNDCLALIEAVELPVARLDAEIRGRGKDDPRVDVLTVLPGVGTLTALTILAEVGDITRFSSARKLGVVGRFDPNGSQLRPHRAARAHLQARFGLAALDLVRGGATREARPHLRRDLPVDRETPRQQDRHHRDRAAAAHPRLPPTR